MIRSGDTYRREYVFEVIRYLLLVIEHKREYHAAEQQREQPAYRIITQTFEGTEIPAGAIPDNATDIEITTVTE